jgi:hypothetical protein
MDEGKGAQEHEKTGKGGGRKEWLFGVGAYSLEAEAADDDSEEEDDDEEEEEDTGRGRGRGGRIGSMFAALSVDEG